MEVVQKINVLIKFIELYNRNNTYHLIPKINEHVRQLSMFTWLGLSRRAMMSRAYGASNLREIATTELDDQFYIFVHKYKKKKTCG